MTPNDGPICDHARQWCYMVGCPNGTLADAIRFVIKAGRTRFSTIAEALDLEEYSAWRELDREMQRMRKKGLIKFVSRSKGWRVATEKRGTPGKT